MKTKILSILMLFTGSLQIQGQVVSASNNLKSGEYIISSNGVGSSEGNVSTKLLQYDNNRHIILDMQNGTNSNYARFLLITKGRMAVKYVEIPSEYHVKDFSILQNTLYFCGITGESGFIAYFDIEKIFYQSGTSFSSTLIPTTLTVNRIETYFNSNNVPIVAGIGKQYYGNHPYWHSYNTYLPDPGPINGINKSLPPGEPPAGEWIYPNDSAYYDCLIMNTISPHYDATNDYYYNDVLLYRHKDSLHHSSMLWEEFRDIAITDNYICIASVTDFVLTSVGDVCVGNEIILRTFDRNTLVGQVSQKLNYIYGDNVAHEQYGFHLKALDGDTVAMSYTVNGIINSLSSSHNIVVKVGMNATSFNVNHVTWGGSNIKNIRKPEYFPQIKKLITSVSPGIFESQNIHNDFLYLEMDNIDMLPYAPFTFYPSHRFGIYSYTPSYPTEHQTWDYIVRCNDGYFATVGRHTSGNIHLFENKIQDFQTDLCHKVEETEIFVLEISGFSDYLPHLWPCYYALMEITNGEVTQCSATGLSIYRAIIENRNITAGQTEIIPICNSNY